MVARFVFLEMRTRLNRTNYTLSNVNKTQTKMKIKSGILNTYSKSWNFVHATKSLFAYFINRSKADDGRDNTVCDKTLFVSFFFLLLKSICGHVRNGKLNANRIKFIKSWRQNQTFLLFDQKQQRDTDSYMNLICHSCFILSTIEEYVIIQSGKSGKNGSMKIWRLKWNWIIWFLSRISDSLCLLCV